MSLPPVDLETDHQRILGKLERQFSAIYFPVAGGPRQI
jgi:hypothetical protein